MSKSLKSNPAALLGLVVFLVALAYRFVGIQWGLPNELHLFSYHPDEPINLGAANQIHPESFSFTPHFYNYPTLYLTLLRLVAGPQPTDMTQLGGYFASAHLMGRLISVLAGAFVALAAFSATRRFAGNLGGVIAGAFVAFAPAMVVHSRFQTVDMLAAVFFAWSVERAIALVTTKDANPKQLLQMVLASGVLAGLSMGTKYTGIVALGSLLAALVLVKPKNAVALAGGSVLAAIVVFVITTPGCLLETSKFLADIRFEAQHTREGHGDTFALTGPGFIYHISNLVTGMGLLATLVGIVSLGYACFRRHIWAFVLAASWVPYYLLIGQGQDKFMRYTLPLFFGLACFVAYAIVCGQNKKGWGLAVVALGIFGLGGADRGGLMSSANYTMLMAGKEPRDEAARYLKEKAKGKSVGLVTDPWTYTAPIYPLTGRPRNRWEVYAQDMASSDPRVVRYAPANPEERLEWDPRLISEAKPDYITFSNIESERYEYWLRLGPGIEARYKEQAARYDQFVKELNDKYVVDAIFGQLDQTPAVHDMEYVRPVIQVWKRKDLP